MQKSEAYRLLMSQLNATGSNKKDGYYDGIMEEIYDWERNEVEDLIWNAFHNNNEIGLIKFLPKLKRYDGIRALKECPYIHQIPSVCSAEIAKILYETTGAEAYLDIIKKNIDMCPNNIVYVSILSYCKPCPKLHSFLVEIYINNKNKVNRNSAVMGLLYEKGIISDRSSIEEANNTIELRRKFNSEDQEERVKIVKNFENGILFTDS